MWAYKGVPKRNGVCALWESDDPLWRTRYWVFVEKIITQWCKTQHITHQEDTEYFLKKMDIVLTPKVLWVLWIEYSEIIILKLLKINNDAMSLKKRCFKCSNYVSALFEVLTANLGHILEVKGTEQGLDDFKGTPTLTFDQYRFYLQTEVFSALPDQVEL